MLKNLLTSFITHSFRSLVGLCGHRANYLVYKCLEPSNFLLNLTNIKPVVLTSRNYTKALGAKGGKTGEINGKELAEAFDIDELEEDFYGPVEQFKTQLRRENQPKPELYHVKNFEFYFEGKTFKVEDVAQVGKNSSGHYVLHFDGAPKAIPSFIKAVQTARSDWKVLTEGMKIHVKLPPVKTDVRPVLKKSCKSHLNACKDELMIVKNKYLRKLSKQDALGVGTKLKVQDQLDDLSDQLIKEAETHLEQKLLELNQGSEK